MTSATRVEFPRASLGMLLASVVLAAACDSAEVGPEPGRGDGYLTIAVVRTSMAAGASEGRLHVDGPTPSVRNVTSETTDTISGLVPGTYQLGLEYLETGSGAVAEYGGTSATVSAGAISRATIGTESFQAGSPSPTTAKIGDTTTFAVPPVTGAAMYEWEWSQDASFGNAERRISDSPELTLGHTDPGTLHLRVRPQHRFGGLGLWSASAEVAVVDTILRDPKITTPGPTLPGGLVGTHYSVTLEAVLGDGSYAWFLDQDSLPPGLGLDAQSGEISGTPLFNGLPIFENQYGFRIQVLSAGLSDFRDFDINIKVPPKFTTAHVLPSAVVGAFYSVTLEAERGDGTYVYRVVKPSIPDGMALDSLSGTISGIPTVADTFDFRIQVISGGESDFRDFEITVQPPE